jgi:hypothetical protein
MFQVPYVLVKDIESIFISSHWFIIAGVSIHKKSFELVVGNI